jgi:hypothetical protein
MDKEPAISLGSYYGAAISRSFAAGWDWAIGQGLTLTILLGIGAVVCASLYAVIRAFRRSHSWTDAMNSVGKAIRDFLVAGVGAVIVMLVIMFGWFFVRDAPEQLNAANARAKNSEQRLKELTNKLSEKPSGEFSAMFLWPDPPKSALRDVSFHIILDNTMNTPAIMTDLRIIRLSTRHDIDSGRFSILSHCLDKISPVSGGLPTEPPGGWNVGDGIQMTELQKGSISIDGVIAADAAIPVGPKENKYLLAKFTAASETDFTKYNIHDLCMVIYYYQHDAGRKSVICSGTEVKTPLIPRIPNSQEWMFGPTLSAIPIYPETNDKICVASPF